MNCVCGSLQTVWVSLEWMDWLLYSQYLLANLNFELQGGLRYIDFCTGDFSIFPFPGMGTLIFFWFALVSNVNSHVAFCKFLIMMLRNKVSFKVKIQKKWTIQFYIDRQFVKNLLLKNSKWKRCNRLFTILLWFGLI